MQGELVEPFLSAGAAVNGLKDDGYPLACALCFQYEDAVAALLKGGARVDNIVSAAACGDLDFVRACFDANGRLLPEAVLAYPEPFRSIIDGDEVLEIAREHADHDKHPDISRFLRDMEVL